jgi:MerR family transcriptional regulator, light-induced transcriptional regulator
MTDPASGLTTSQLADRTGVAAATLRMWEERHGFPVPARSGSGHRRYRESAVSAVREVLRLREQGLSLAAATSRVRSAEKAPPRSIFAALRERRPELAPTRLTKPALLALTRALEDEYCAHGASGLLIGSFQERRFYRQSSRRWRAMARTSEMAVALADFSRLRKPPGEPAEVPVSHEHPLSREWSLLISSATTQCVLAGWELPASRREPETDRCFEALWSFDPEVVHTATLVADELIAAVSPRQPLRLPAPRLEPPPPSSPELRAGAALSHRAIAYLAAQSVG